MKTRSVFRFSKFFIMLSIGLMSAGSAVSAEPVVNVQVDTKAYSQNFMVHASVEWDQNGGHDYLIKEAVFPDSDHYRLMSQSERVRSFTGPLGTRASREFTAKYAAQNHGSGELGPIQIHYADSRNPDEFMVIETGPVGIKLSHPMIWKSMMILMGAGVLLSAAGGFMIYRKKSSKKSILKPSYSSETLGEIENALSYIYNLDHKGYYRTVDRKLSEYESRYGDRIRDQSGFRELLKEVREMHEKTGYAGFRSSDAEHQLLHSRVTEFMKQQINFENQNGGTVR